MKAAGLVVLWLLAYAATSPTRRQPGRAQDSRGCISKYYNKDLGALEILMMPLGEKLWLRAWLGMHMSNLLHMEGVDLAEVTQSDAERKKRSLSQVVVLDNEKEKKDVLPGNVAPNSYHLWLKPFLGDVRFRGELEINITCLHPTESIMLRANGHLKVNGLTIKKLSSDSKGEQFSTLNENERTERNSIQILKVVWHVKRSLCEIILQKPLAKGSQYQLNFQYFGEFSNNNRGIFLNTYTENNVSAELSWFMGTNLQQGNTMHVFPCFDETRFKATFEVSVARPEGMMAISSSPLRRTESCLDMPGWEWDHFKMTPPMASSSLAIFVFNPQHFFPLSATTVQGEIIVQGFARTSELSVAQETVDALAIGLVYMERHLGVAFPLPQLNVVLLPNLADSVKDFWGLIMFGSNFSFASLWFYLLKQWFGHLVTPESSKDEYVVISLAHYYAYVCPMDVPDSCESDDKNVFSPNFNFMALQDVRDGMSAEEFKWHKMVFFLRMLNHSITEESFKKGVQVFLKYRSYSTFSEDDLWDTIDIQAWSDGKLDRSMTTKVISKSWLIQDYYPVVTFSRNYENNTADVQQQVFVRRWPYIVRGHETMVWWIPITYTTLQNMKEGKHRTLFWLKGQKKLTIKDLPNAESFIIVNDNDVGMYIVNYDNSNWQRLSEFLLKNESEGNTALIPASTRGVLLRNAWYLAISGHLDFPVALNMTLFLKEERDPFVWKILTQIYFMVSWKLTGTGLEVKFDRFIGDLLIHVIQSDSDRKFVTKETRALAYYVLCKAGYKPAVEKARSEFKKWLKHHQEINRGILGGALNWVEDDWECGLDHALYLLRERAPLKTRSLLLSQLAVTTKNDNIERLLKLVLVDHRFVFSNGEMKSVVAAASNCTMFIQFLSSHWGTLKERYESEPNMWQYILEEAARKCKTPGSLKVVEEFYKMYQNDFGSSAGAMKHAMEISRHNIEVIYHKLPQFDEALSLYVPLEAQNNDFCENEYCINTSDDCTY